MTNTIAAITLNLHWCMMKSWITDSEVAVIPLISILSQSEIIWLKATDMS